MNARELHLRRLVETSPGSATLNGVPIGGGDTGRDRRKNATPPPRGRGVREVATYREWPNISAAAKAFGKRHEWIVRLADRGEVLRWA